MRWQFAAVLWALPLVPVLLYVRHRVHRRVRGLRYAELSLLGSESDWRRHREAIRTTLVGASLVLILLGIAQPEVLRRASSVSVEGIDIALALDISRSMRAEDFPPNRLEAAKRTLREFVKGRRDDRIALVVFAGDAFLQCPLTLDHDALDGLIGAADFSLSDVEGTAIGDAVATAAGRIKDSDAESRVVILLTDGENNRGNVDPQTAAQAAAALGIRVYAVGVGGRTGAPIPTDDPVFGRGYVRNADGSMLMTKLDEQLLQDIAAATGGRYFNAQDAQALDAVYASIDRLERRTLERHAPPTYASLSHWFYLAAALLVLCDAWLSRTALRVVP